jgi:predicted homoserine dehydrogenase-like protein
MVYDDLLRLESEGKPLRIGVSGAGWMGSGFVAQVSHVPGMKVVVLADSDTARATEVLLRYGVQKDDIVETTKSGEADDAIKGGKTVVTGDHTFVAQLENVDVVTDVTPSPATGAETRTLCL